MAICKYRNPKELLVDFSGYSHPSIQGIHLELCFCLTSQQMQVAKYLLIFATCKYSHNSCFHPSEAREDLHAQCQLFQSCACFRARKLFMDVFSQRAFLKESHIRYLINPKRKMNGIGKKHLIFLFFIFF